MKKILTFLAISVFLSGFAFAQDDSAYGKALKKMFSVSGTEEVYQAAIKQIVVMFKQQYSNTNDEIWDELEKEFSKTKIDELVEMLTPIYAKYLTQEDLEAMIEFYKTPVGKKFAKSAPFITQESIQAGHQWGLKLGEEFAKKMKEKGY